MGIFGWRSGNKADAGQQSIQRKSSSSMVEEADDLLKVGRGDDMQVSVWLQDRTLCCVDVKAHVPASPDMLFDILADPSNHPHVFDSIKAAKSELVEDNGPQKVWRLDYKTAWKFWRVGGVCDSRVTMWTDHNAKTVTFKLREPGFLRVYEGTWTLSPATSTSTRRTCSRKLSRTLSRGASGLACTASGSGSRLRSGSGLSSAGLGDLSTSPRAALTEATNFANMGNPLEAMQQSLQKLDLAAGLNNLASFTPFEAASKKPMAPEPAISECLIRVEKMMCPSVAPPYPLNLALKGQAASQVQDMIRGLSAAAQRRLQAAA